MAGPQRYLEDQGIAIAQGRVVDTSVRNIFGVQPETPNANFVPLWENATAYTYPTVAVQLDVQTAATDTATIKIIGLDANYNEISEVVVLNGIILTDQTTTTEFFRVNDLITIAGNCTGNVTVVQTGTSDVVAKMNGGTGRNQASIYTVPAGCEFHLTRLNGYTAETGLNPNERTAFFRNFVGLSNGVELRVAELAFHNTFNIYRTNPFKYSEKTDIQLQMKASATSQECAIFAEGLVIKMR